MKRISEFSTKQTFIAILVAYFVLVMVIAMFCFLTRQDAPASIGKAFVYVGIIISGLGLLMLQQTGSERGSGYAASPFMKNRDYQRKSIEADKPYRKVISMIIFAGVMLAGTGYFLMSFFA